MLASFLITFREGLEAFLLIGIILATLRHLGGRVFFKWIHLGAVAGIIASLGVAVLFQLVIDQFQNEFYQGLLMIGVLGAASLILSYMALWMQRQARAHTESVKAQLARHVGAGNLLGMVGLAFVSVLREGLETVLFFSALIYSGQGVEASEGITGAFLGLGIAIVLVWMLMRGARRLPLSAFFRWTSFLVIVIAAGLVGSAVNMAQGIGLADLWTASLFDISFILDDRGLVGTFLRALFGYNSSPTGLQFLCWLSYLAVGLTLWHRGYARAA